MLAWYEAERKKRPRSPKVDGSENEENPQKKLVSTRNEGMLNLDESRSQLKLKS
jgi:hypothetical protein